MSNNIDPSNGEGIAVTLMFIVFVIIIPLVMFAL